MISKKVYLEPDLTESTGGQIAAKGHLFQTEADQAVTPLY
jgi:hypothetical protein